MARQAYATEWEEDDKAQTLLQDQTMASQQYRQEQVKECGKTCVSKYLLHALGGKVCCSDVHSSGRGRPH